MTISGFDEVTAQEPEKTLLESLPTHAGRNNQGRITTRHQGGGYRKLYRKIDFKRDKHGVPGKVATIEYDPNRSARIALIHYKDGEKRYILAPDGLAVGTVIESGPQADIKVGNCLPLANIPLGRLGDPEKDAGSLAVFLASEGAHYLTGETFNIDGGRCMRP